MANKNIFKETIEQVEAAKKILEKKYAGKKKSFDHQMAEGIFDLALATFTQFEEGDGLNLLDDDEKKQKYEDFLYDKFKKLSKDELLKKLAKTTLDAEYFSKLSHFFKNQLDFFQEQNTEHLKNKIQSHRNKMLGRAEVFKNNNDCMKKCLDEILSTGSGDKNISKHTYIRFCRLVTKNYPKPPFIQKLRQTKAEKLQDHATQKIDLEALQRNEWAPSTLRKFFEKALKVKIVNLP